MPAAAVQVTDAAVLPRVAVTSVGASGAAAGVIAFDGLLAGLVPAALEATTVKV